MFLMPLGIGLAFGLISSFMQKRTLEVMPKEPTIYGVSQNKALGVAGLGLALLASGPLALIGAIVGGAAISTEMMRVQVDDGIKRNLWNATAQQAQLEQQAAAEQAAAQQAAAQQAAAPAAPGGGGFFSQFLSPFFSHPVPQAP